MTTLLPRLAYFLKDFKWYLLILILSIFLSLLTLLKITKSTQKLNKNLLLSITASIISLIFLFIFSEAYFRYIYNTSDGIGYLLVNQKWYQRHVQYNGDFLRDKEFVTSKPKGEFRIAAIGDSITFGLGIENPKDRYPDLLEASLKKDGHNVSVYNLGFSGISAHETIASFKTREYLDFDLVVWQYFLNDANTATTSANAKITIDNKNRFPSTPWLNNIFDNSYFADFLFWRFTSKYDQVFKSLVNEDIKLYHDPQIFPGHEKEITDFLEYLKDKNIPAVVLLFPLIHSEEIRRASQVEYQKMLKVFNSSQATSVIDLAKTYQAYPVDDLKASRFDQHPNELAHKIASELLYARLKTLIP